MLRDAHTLTPEEVVAALDTGEKGLTSEQATRLLERNGPNSLPAAEQETWWQRLLRQFNDPMIYVLIVAGLLTAFMGQVIDTIVIFAVVLINALVGFFQEGKAADALASIKEMLSPESVVLRDGTWQKIPAEELVDGDVVRLNAGDRVPADLRLVQVSSLRIEESALTGESVPASKSLEVVAADAGVGDRPDMAFSGTTVAAGSGIGVVTGTGSDTEIGKITTMLDEVQQVETPLTKAMSKFSSFIAVVAVVLAILMLVVSWLLYQTPWDDLLMSGIGFAVAAIPEGLPAVMAITLALGVQRMADRKAITRRMNSVETLGSVTTICSDKTGTLTRNEMTVRAVVTAQGITEVTGTGYNVSGEVLADEVDEDIAMLARIATYANSSTLSAEGQVQGEPTDAAIAVFAQKAGVEATAPRIDEVPFDSEHKYHASLNGDTIYLKGAPDRLLDRCEGADREMWEQRIEELGSRGLRVLAAAYKPGEAVSKEIVDAGGFTFVGLYGLIDPPREESIQAVRDVQNAGIKVRMITGDHASTAEAIAKEIGITDGRTVTGAEIEKASDVELREIVKDAAVYSRTSPEHKLRLVQAMQANGEVVSMTGDGVNDAPTLKQADVGVAMGIKGTEATKDAADIVLADDNFATIAVAVKMGRTIFDNLRKAIMFMLPTNGAQGLVIFVAMIFGHTLPITPLQVLWINLITAVTLSLALSFEPSEPGIMERKPRDPKAGLLDGAGIFRVVYVSLLLGALTSVAFTWSQNAGHALEVSRTIAVTTLAVAQIFYLFTARFTEVSALRKELFTTNPVSWACVGIMIALQLAFVYLPPFQYAFTTVALSWQGWVIAILAGLVVFAVVEVEKAIRRALPARDNRRSTDPHPHPA